MKECARNGIVDLIQRRSKMSQPDKPDKGHGSMETAMDNREALLSTSLLFRQSRTGS